MLPGHLGELARRGHGAAALKLIHAWGGTKRRIPKVPRPGQPIVAIMGLAAARELADLCGALDYDIPSKACLSTSVKAQILRADGGTREIAEAHGCTERYVRMIRSDPTAALAAPRRRRRIADERQTDIEAWLAGPPPPRGE